MFEAVYNEQVLEFIARIAKKNKTIAQAINKKINEILNRNKDTIQYYKNLSEDLKQFKRVHITNWLVLMFEVDFEANCIIFHKIGHRKDVYKK